MSSEMSDTIKQEKFIIMYVQHWSNTWIQEFISCKPGVILYILDFLHHPLNIYVCNFTMKINTVRRNHITLSPTCFSQALPSSDRIRKIPNGNYWSFILKTGALSQLIYYKVYIYINIQSDKLKIKHRHTASLLAIAWLNSTIATLADIFCHTV
jgi:hypothetical protein